MSFTGEFAVKFALQAASHHTIPDLVQLAQLARNCGFKQVWVNDNLGQRNLFVVLSAVAASVPIKVGTSIVVPYFRNPIDLADSLAALTELTAGREVSVGVARGDQAYAGRQIKTEKPLAIVRETVLVVRALLAGEAVLFREYPNCAAFHHIESEFKFHLDFAPRSPVRFYGAGNGPKSMHAAGEFMDGTLIGNHFIPLVRSGRLGALLAAARTAVRARNVNFFDIAEIDISVAHDRHQAIEFAKPYAATILHYFNRMNFTDEELTAMGVAPGLMATVNSARAGGATTHDIARMIPDDAVTRFVIAGAPEDCLRQLAPLMSEAERLGIKQICFTKLGPDWRAAIELLSEQGLSRSASDQ